MIFINIAEVGKRIREARLNKGYTQQELADQCNVTKSLLSKIENGQTASAVATLSRIADALETPLSWFLEEEKEQNIIVLQQKSRMTRAKMGNKETHYIYEILANRSRFSKIEPLLITFLPESDITEPFTHPEDEFIYVLSGSIHLNYGGEIYLLEEGDSVYINGQVPHIAFPLNNQEAKIISIFIDRSNI